MKSGRLAALLIGLVILIGFVAVGIAIDNLVSPSRPMPGAVKLSGHSATAHRSKLGEGVGGPTRSSVPSLPPAPTTTTSSTTTPPAPTTTLPPPTTTSASTASVGTTSSVPVESTATPDPVTTLEREEWTRVAVCEEGGWVGSSGSAYPDSLGINAANWYGNGGGSTVSEDAQIEVAMRIQSNPPDQDGCAAW